MNSSRPRFGVDVTTESLLIVGCGGFGREVHDVVDALNLEAVSHGDVEPWSFLGYLDDSPSQEDRRRVIERGSVILGPTALFGAYAGVHYVVAIANGSIRAQLANRADEAGLTAATLTHPSATYGAKVSIASGSVICAGVRLTTNIQIGQHVHVNLNSTVGHDSRLGDFCTVNPLVAVSGNCTIGKRAMLGTHSAILQGITVGADSSVGAGACVIRDVPNGVVVKGIPAR